MVLKISGANYQFQGKQSCLVFFFFVKVIFTIVFFCWTIVSKKGWGGSGNTQKKWVLCRCFPFSKERIFRWTSCSFSGSVCLFVWLISNIFFPPDPEKNLRIQKTQGGSYSVTNAHSWDDSSKGVRTWKSKNLSDFVFIAWKNPCQVIVKSSEKMLESSMLPKMRLETYGD